MGTLQHTVKSLVTLAQGMSKKDLEKAQVVASIIKAIADVAKAMSPTLVEMAKSEQIKTATAHLRGGKVQKTTNVVLEGLTKMFEIMQEKLPPFVKALVKVMKDSFAGMDPKVVAAQAKALGDIMTAIKIAMDGVSAFQAMVAKNDDWKTSTKGAQKEVLSLFSAMGTLLGPRGGITVMIRSMVGLGKELSKAKDINVKEIKSGIAILSDLSEKQLPGFMTALEKMQEVEMPDLSKKSGLIFKGPSIKDQIVTSMTTVADMVLGATKAFKPIAGISLAGISEPFAVLQIAMVSMEKIVEGFNNKYFGDEGKVVSAVTALMESYDSTYAALSSVANDPIDLNMKLKSFAETMGMSSESFTIKNEKLNFTVNVGVTIDAEKLVDVLSEHKTMGKRTVQVVGGT